MTIIGSHFETMSTTYTVERVLGEGGAGRVLAVQDEKGSPHALKVLAWERVSKERVKRFRNELAFCERDIHPAIVQVEDYGFVEKDGRKIPFYVMPRYSSTLRAHITNGLAPEQALKTFVRILDGVEAAHLREVWHRDLKPENFLANGDPTKLVVADFGIAHFGEEVLATAIETRDDARLANFVYAAPEQKQRGAKIDARTDIFSLGLILVELFTGEVPHAKGHKTISSTAPAYAYLDGIANQMLSQAAEDRPVTIGRIKEQLIGRELEFVSKQKLDTATKAVVPQSAVPNVPDFSFASFDYRDGRLLITLNAEPPRGWMEIFKNPNTNHSAIIGSGPEAFSLNGRTLSVPVRENSVEAVVHHARDYAAKASAGLRRHLARVAEKRDREERARLAREVAAEEERLRVLARLNKIGGAG
jgi:serine/threonine protein kinase